MPRNYVAPSERKIGDREMAPVLRRDARRASPSAPPTKKPDDTDNDLCTLTEFDQELEMLSAANEQLLSELRGGGTKSEDAIIAAVVLAPAVAEELELLRLENAELKARIDELEALGAGEGEELWLERQHEYEMLVEEKSEVIRSLHQKLQEAEESALGGPAPTLLPNAPVSATRLGQAEEILRLKRELDEQRRQIEQDERDMMDQMKQMELAMAKERAEMARQKQEVQRLKDELAREIEQSSRDPDLRERLNRLRRNQDQKPASKPPAGATPEQKEEEKNTGFFSRLFG